jgi:hypothetical protein
MRILFDFLSRVPDLIMHSWEDGVSENRRYTNGFEE